MVPTRLVAISATALLLACSKSQTPSAPGVQDDVALTAVASCDDLSAIVHDTPYRQGPQAPPGHYTVKLVVDGRTYTQPLTVKPDPRH